MRTVLNEIIIKHLSPRSEEELSKLPKMIITEDDIEQLKKLPVSEMRDVLEKEFSFDAKYDWLKKNRKRFEPGRWYFQYSPKILDTLIIELITHPEVNEAIKHLSPRTKEEIQAQLEEKYVGKYFKSRYSVPAASEHHRKEIIKITAVEYQEEHIDDYRWYLIGTNIYRKGTGYKFSPIRLFDNEYHEVFPKKDTVGRIRYVNEAIKHLGPKTQEELKKYYDKLSPDDKVKEGCQHELIWLVKQGLDEGANYAKAYKNMYYVVSANKHFMREIQGLRFLITERKQKLRDSLKGRTATDRHNFATHFHIDWLRDEIEENEGHILRQEELADEFSQYEDKNPLYIRDKIRDIFDPLKESGFKIDYKIIDDKKYHFEITLTQNVYLSDVLEDITIEDEEPIEFKIKIFLNVFDTKINYNFYAKYKDGADIGYDEGTFTIDRKTMGKQLEDHLDYLLGDVVETEYERFKKDILDITEKIHTESEPFDEEKYYPQLQEGIKHLSGRSEEETGKYKEELREKLRDLSLRMKNLQLEKRKIALEMSGANYINLPKLAIKKDNLENKIRKIANLYHSIFIDFHNMGGELQEGIKHLSPKSEKEIEKYLTTSKNIEEYITANMPRVSVNVSDDLKNISFRTRWYIKANDNVEDLIDDLYFLAELRGNYDLRINYFFYKIEVEIDSSIDEEKFSGHMSILKQLYQWRFFEEKSEKLSELKGKGLNTKIKYVTKQISNKKLSEKFDPLILDDFQRYIEMFGKREDYDDSVYYPQLQEGIKHLGGRDMTEVDKNNKQTLKEARDYILSNDLFINVSEIEDGEFKFIPKNEIGIFKIYTQHHRLFITVTQYKKWRYFNSFSNTDDFIHQIDHALTLLKK